MSKLLLVSFSSVLVACIQSANPPPSTLKPLASNHTLPSVDSLGMRTQLLGANPKVDLRLCTDASGQVASIEVEHGSALNTFDTAVMKDVRTWTFAAQRAPSCRILEIRYMPQA